jgi:hypothetical protein
MFQKIFSKRNQAPANTLSETVSPIARKRIMHTLAQLCQRPESPGGSYATASFPTILEDVAQRCFREYGNIECKSGEATDIAEAAHVHFKNCDDSKAIDFLEMLFQSEHSMPINRFSVDEVNTILREEGIGYEFTRYVFNTREIGSADHGRKSYRTEVEYPSAIRKTSESIHVEVVVPTLTILADVKWKIANQEMHEAFKAVREGRLDDANIACGRALESVFKTICGEKRWKYDPQRDTLANLIDICRDKGLYPPFYCEIFKASGTIRNKLGAHGKGPNPLYQNDEALVMHMIHQSSANILLLAKLANMK